MLWRRPSTQILIFTGRSSTITTTSLPNSLQICLPWITLISSLLVPSKRLLEGMFSKNLPKLVILFRILELKSYPVMFQQGHCWTIWVSHCIYSSWTVPRGAWNQCLWSKIQHCFTWSGYVSLLPLLRGREEAQTLSSWNWGATLQFYWEWWAQVRIEKSFNLCSFI